MKILKLRFKNLNSLSGEWEIDFTIPDYSSDGIFAITGSTGSGKTTILDAITLALFGQTCRLGKITKSSNEIMTRHKGDCYAEIEFLTAKGQYRCHWSHHRSRYESTGELQIPKHEITDGISGRILASKKTNVLDKVEEVIGMDFTRFTRSILLAQGGFAAFLDAKPNERAPILEQITGTEIYSTISIKVHEKINEEKLNLKELKDRLEGIPILHNEEVKHLKATQAGLKKETIELKTKIEDTKSLLNWKQVMIDLEQDLEMLEEEWEKFQEVKIDSAEDINKLNLANKALTLEGKYEKLNNLRELQDIELSEHETELNNKQTLSEIIKEANSDYESAFKALAKFKSESKPLAKLLKEVRKLDLTIEITSSQKDDIEVIILALTDEIGTYETKIDELLDDLHYEEANLNTIQKFIKSNKKDKNIQGAFTGIKKQFELVEKIKAKYEKVDNELDNSSDCLDETNNELTQKQNMFEESDLALKAAKEILDSSSKQLKSVIKSKTLKSLRSEEKTLSEKVSNYEKIIELLGNISDGEEEVKILKERISVLQVSKKGKTESKSKLTEKRKRLKQNVDLLQDKYNLTCRVRDLEEDREFLEDGKPCPLCGALKHPYSSGKAPKPDKAQIELKKASDALDKVITELGDVQDEITTITSEIKQNNKAINALYISISKYIDSISRIPDYKSARPANKRKLKNFESKHETSLAKLLDIQNIIELAEEAEDINKNAKSEYDEFQKKLRDCDKALDKAKSDFKKAHSDHKKINTAHKETVNDLKEAKKELRNLIKPFGIKNIDEYEADHYLNSLSDRNNEYREAVENRDNLVNKITEFKSSITEQNALLAKVEKDLEISKNELTSLDKSLNTQKSERHKVFGNKVPDEEEESFNQEIIEAEEKYDISLEELNKVKVRVNTNLTKISELNNSTSTRKKELSKIEREFHKSLRKFGFHNEDEFDKYRLDKGEIDQLTNKIKRLEKEETELATKLDLKTNEVQKHEKSDLTNRDIDDLQEEYSQINTEFEELQNEIGEIRNQLNEDAKHKKSKNRQLKLIKKQSKEVEKWGQLHQLIGSADGKKFRNFAQGLTFEMMINHANHELMKMSDRYILVQDHNETLVLNIIDNYQAGDIRSTKNLSGGESFIVSLSLALGLSNMASNNVSVDSLYLDEGFGSLDEDSLDIALETLANLHHEGKLIGLISHVKALKERIGTQIQVTSKSNGIGVIKGPGCKRVS